MRRFLQRSYEDFIHFLYNYVKSDKMFLHVLWYGNAEKANNNSVCRTILPRKAKNHIQIFKGPNLLCRNFNRPNYTIGQKLIKPKFHWAEKGVVVYTQPFFEHIFSFWKKICLECGKKQFCLFLKDWKKFGFLN